MADKPDSFWKNVIFSDETMISLNSFSLANRVRRFPWTNPYSPKLVSPSVKHPLAVMFWGCFSFDGSSSLEPVSGYMNKVKYMETLERNLVPIIAENSIFQDDSAPCHRAKVVDQWFQEKAIARLEWPGNSPDLNPIENFWSILKRKLAGYKISNKRELIAAVNVEFQKIVQNETLVQNLVLSMKNRIRDVIKNKGYATKY